jgi:hypothetical protein
MTTTSRSKRAAAADDERAVRMQSKEEYEWIDFGSNSNGKRKRTKYTSPTQRQLVNIFSGNTSNDCAMGEKETRNDVEGSSTEIIIETRGGVGEDDGKGRNTNEYMTLMEFEALFDSISSGFIEGGEGKRGDINGASNRIISASEFGSSSDSERKCNAEVGSCKESSEKVVGVKVKCKYPSGCNNSAEFTTKGMCKTHGGQRRCKHESNCEKRVVSNGLCVEHGGIKLRKKCTHDSICVKLVVSKGLCSAHGGWRKCKHESNCEKRVVSKGLCIAYEENGRSARMIVAV